MKIVKSLIALVVLVAIIACLLIVARKGGSSPSPTGVTSNGNVK